MKIVIDIDEGIYNKIQKDDYGAFQISIAMKAIKSGTPLKEETAPIKSTDKIFNALQKARERFTESSTVVETNYKPAEHTCSYWENGKCVMGKANCPDSPSCSMYLLKR